MEQYVTNPNFKGTEEEARRQIVEYEEAVKWLEEHEDYIIYDKKTGGYVITIEAPEYVIKRIEKMNEAEKRRRERVMLLKEMGVLE